MALSHLTVCVRKTTMKMCREICCILWILVIYQQMLQSSCVERHTNIHKYVDIYTNYPNLEKVLQEETDTKYLSRNLWKQQNNTIKYNYGKLSGLRAKYRPNFIQIQSAKLLDNIEPQNQTQVKLMPRTRSFVYEEIPQAINGSSHVQKIDRRMSLENSKQLESSGNIFTKINTVLRDQFSRFFQFGNAGKQAATVRPIGKKGVMKAHKRNATIEQESKLDEKKRFLSIFTILQFDNSRCVAQGGVSGFEGTCYHRLECSQLGGVNMGSCAKDYGVCCVFRYTCGDYSNQNVSYFECEPGSEKPPITMSPPTVMPPITSVPDIDPRLNITAMLTKLEQWHRQTMGTGSIVTGGSPCTFTVDKVSPGVRQLRIDFLDFDLRGPTNGECLQDKLVITGQNINSVIPVICGYNTGQHVYVDVSDAIGPIMLSVTTANPEEKRFRIKVSQIRAPCATDMNCLQYYTDVMGVVQTLNYDPSPRGLSSPQYFNNMNYAICIRKEAGYCTITYSNTQNGIESPFSLRNVDSNGDILMPPGQAGAEIFNCPDDYIVINGVRLCGDRLNDGTVNEDFRINAPVTDNTGGPFIIPVRTNGNMVARGFRLYYRQNRCMTT